MTYHRNLIIRARRIIIPPTPIHRPPRDRLEIVQTQHLFQVRLDVFFRLRRAGRRGGGTRDGDTGRRWGWGGGGGGGEGGGDEGA